MICVTVFHHPYVSTRRAFHVISGDRFCRVDDAKSYELKPLLVSREGRCLQTTKHERRLVGLRVSFIKLVTTSWARLFPPELMRLRLGPFLVL